MPNNDDSDGEEEKMEVKEKPTSLPEQVPESWMAAHEAATKGYIKVMNYELTIARLDYNDPIFNLTTSNIKLEKKILLRMCLSVTSEAALLKVKFGLYAILTTALPQLSVIPSGMWLTLEVLYFILIIYGVLRYRYF